MLNKRPALRAWLIAVGMSTLMFLLLFLFSDMYFAANDDKAILRTFMDFQPSGAGNFHLYIHAMYAYPLQWLSKLTPGVAWFSILEIILLWFADTVILKSILMCCEHARRPLWLGVILCGAFLCMFGMENGARITYTVTAAMLCAAAVGQILSVDIENATNKQIVARMSFALFLIVLAYGLRQMTALPALAFCGIAFCLRFAQHFGIGKQMKRSAKPLIATLALVAVVMGGLCVAREIEIDARDKREYLNWQQARISVLDYINLDSVPREVYDEIGWSEVQVELLENWYTMDERFSTEAFQTVREKGYTSDTRTSPGAALLDLQTRSPRMVRAFICLCLIGVMALLFLAIFHKGKRLCLLASLCATGLGCFALFCYLAWQGRLPYRAVLVPVLPAASLVFCLFSDCMPDVLRPKSKKRFVRAAAGIMVGLLALSCAVPNALVIRKIPPKWDYNTFEDLDHQGLTHPDLLLIYNNDMVNDMRLFPDTSEGMPTNVMFWGGWERGSTEYDSRLAAFGLDGESFTAADWLRPFIRHVTTSSEGYEPLLRYLREEVDPRVACEREQLSAGLYAYRFFIPEETGNERSSPGTSIILQEEANEKAVS